MCPMKQVSAVLIIVGPAIILWSTYIFIKYVGLGGDNSYTPYSGLTGIILLVLGIRLRKK